MLEGLGTDHYPVTTRSERAQRFFDQGLKLTYGFNHQEALRAFKEAARLDPDCAMAYGGWALVLGPNLNLPMRPEVVSQAHQAVQTAMSLRDEVSQKERALIEALARRYSDDPEADRAPLDQAYAEAMGKLHAEYPADNDIATLYAASLVNLSPWDYWTRDGRPKGRTPQILTALEGAMERDPEHEGALHYDIHASEAVDPQRGVWAADQLRGLAYLNTDRPKGAKRELDALNAVVDDPKTTKVLIGLSHAGRLLSIARELLAGAYQAKHGRHETALGHLERATRLEDSLRYNEPPDCFYPTRHSLGAVLLEAGFPLEAEAVYWRDLAKNRGNGYALYGLYQALRAQDRKEEAAEIEQRFRAAWADADIRLSSSRL